jgi:hypothetical protein
MYVSQVGASSIIAAVRSRSRMRLKKTLPSIESSEPGEAGHRSTHMNDSLTRLVEHVVQIAWDVLELSGEIADPSGASRFLVQTVAQLVVKDDAGSYSSTVQLMITGNTSKPWLREADLLDSLTKRERPDRSKINMSQPHEVKYSTHALGVSKEELQKAVDKVGNSAAAVRKEIGIRSDSHK